VVFLNVFELILESELLVQLPSAFLFHSSHLILPARARSNIVIWARQIPEWVINNAAPRLIMDPDSADGADGTRWSPWPEMDSTASISRGIRARSSSSA
jgi:hypothetical protein